MKRHRYIVILLILVTLFILIGHFILSNGNIKKRYLNVYFKSKNTNFIIHVEVDNKLLHLIDRESKQVLKKYPVATGKPSSPTPLGTYEITDMGQWGQGFGSRWTLTSFRSNVANPSQCVDLPRCRASAKSTPLSARSRAAATIAPSSTVTVGRPANALSAPATSWARYSYVLRSTQSTSSITVVATKTGRPSIRARARAD